MLEGQGKRVRGCRRLWVAARLKEIGEDEIEEIKIQSWV